MAKDASHAGGDRNRGPGDCWRTRKREHSELRANNEQRDARCPWRRIDAIAADPRPRIHGCVLSQPVAQQNVVPGRTSI